MILNIFKELLAEKEFVSAEEEKDFASFTIDKLFGEYNKQYMENETYYRTMMNDIQIVLPNGMVGKEYSATFIIPNDVAKIVSIEMTNASNGLEIAVSEEGECVISGVPELAGNIDLVIKYTYKGWIVGKPQLERKVSFTINPDPKSLWEDIPTDEKIEYFQTDKECEYVKVAEKEGQLRKDIVVASLRGRSHAHKGSPRDDHYKVMFNEESEWYILAVADGAGSAKYSRRGATIACDTVADFCNESLKNGQDFEELIRKFSNDQNDVNRKAVGDKLYSLLGAAALNAAKAIEDEVIRVNKLNQDKMDELTAKQKELNPNVQTQRATRVEERDYYTTLLLSICKKFEFGWFVASFWVGDGAICIYNKENGTAKLMGVPDEGEQAGQTIFLNMKKTVFKDATSLYNRLRFQIEDDFTALFLMTDGVSDPKFGTDVNLNDIKKWNELWEDLAGNNKDKCRVNLTDDNESAKDELLQWLNFYTDGHHDDRTIAILY